MSTIIGPVNHNKVTQPLMKFTQQTCSDLNLSMFVTLSHPALRMGLARTIWARSLATATPINEQIKNLVNEDKVVVFMKGVPEQPRCGFSNAVVQIMRMHDVQFKAHDVLQDEELRQGVKDFSEWPTIPQVYMKGEFLGGCDILLQMHQSGEFIEELEKVGIKSALLDQPKEDDPKDK